MKRTRSHDPFRVLGLAAGPDLTDDDVRAAWRRIATATHPDRADGGDPERFAAAAAAYTALRARYSRNEALADLRAQQLNRSRGPGGRWRAREPLARRPLVIRWPGHRLFRPWLLAARIIATAAACTAVFAVAGTRPATPALITGALTWLILTGRRDFG